MRQVTKSILAQSLLVGAVSMTTQAHAMDLHLQQASVNTHRSQGDVREVQGATGTMVRSESGIFVDVKTKDLTPRHVYRNCKQQGSFIARKEDRHHSGHGTIVKSKGSLMPLLGRFLKKGTDNVKEVGVQPPVEDQRPSSD